MSRTDYPSRIKKVWMMNSSKDRIRDPVLDARILLVEDSWEYQLLITEKLRNCGIHNVTVCESSEQGFEELKDNIESFDLIIVDYSLPNTSGLGIIRKIKNINPILPIIMISGSGSEKVAIEAMKLGVEHYLVKDEISSQDIIQEIIPQELIRSYSLRQTDLKVHLENNSCQLSVLVFRFGLLGPEPFLTSCLPFENGLDEKQREEYLIKLGTQYMTATGAGHEYALGLFELPVFGHNNYHALVYSFWMKEKNHPDKRIRQNEGNNYGLVVILYPKIFRAILPTRFEIEKKIDHIISLYESMDELNQVFIEKIRNIFLD
ncbi:MAG: response regulator [Candidatus Hodarchaeales archaeon]